MGGWFLSLVAPPADSTSDDVRKVGRRAMLVGLPILAIGVVVFVLVTQSLRAHGLTWAPQAGRSAIGKLVAAPMAVGYLLTMMGLYRAVTGKATGSTSGAASAGRIVLGVVLTIVSIVAIAVVIAIATAHPPTAP